VKRAIVVAISVILALAVAAPIASGQSSSKSQNLGELTGDWWNWAASTSPSPLEGSYKRGTRCDGNFVEGVFFLAGSTTPSPVERTCTVPADTPILFPVVNVVCSEAYPTDPKPYTKCARNTIDAALVGSTTFATLDEEPLTIQRIASGPFDWTVESAANPFGVPEAGTFDAASDGLWVYLSEGLERGKYTLEFGGDFPNVGFQQNITYTLKVRCS
jgi:hypothetical protein